MTFSSTRRQAFRQLGMLLATSTLPVLNGPARASTERDNASERTGGRDTLRRGKLFIGTNAPTGNEVWVYSAAEAGPASLLTRVPTGGAGTGGGLGSQGAVTLSRNGRYLFAVNAASNTVSTFAFSGASMVLVSVVDSGGLLPTSVSEHDGLVCVLNAGGDGNVTGLRNIDGVLVPVVGGTRPLSAAGGTAPAQVGFGRDGELLVISERNTNRLTSYPVRPGGTLGTQVVTASGGITPFGFVITRRDHLIVSEAAGGASGGSTVSSYRFDDRAPAAPVLVSRAVPTLQTAACWIAATPDGRHAYSANAGSSSISSFAIARNGAISLLQSEAGSTGPNAGAIDMAVTPDGQQLHAFASRSLEIVAFAIAADGGLTALGSVGGLPAGSAGLAAN